VWSLTSWGAAELDTRGDDRWNPLPVVDTKAAGGSWSIQQVTTTRQADLGPDASPEDVFAWATQPTN
jgi:hypothetical protein